MTSLPLPLRAAQALAVPLLALALAVVMTWPLAFKLADGGRVNTGDGQLSIWNVAWVARTLAVDPLGVFHANIFYPHRNTLAFSESNLGAGFLALPFYWATENPYTTHNAIALLSFAFSFMAMYGLARYLTSAAGPAVIAAISFAFCPYVFARTAHIQLLMTAGLPLSLLAFHRFVDRRTWGRAAILGIVLAAQALTCAYYGIFAGMIVGVGVLTSGIARGLWRNGGYWLRIAGAAALSIALVLPAFLPYIKIQRETGFARTLDDARMYAADWQAYLASAAWAHRWMLPVLGEWNEVLFPGLLVTGLGVAGIRLGLRRQTTAAERIDRAAAASPIASAQALPAARMREATVLYTLVGALALWASFGPDAGLYTLFYNTIPVFSLLRAPARFGLIVTLSLSVLTAIALSRLLAGRAPRRQLGIASLVAAALTLELATAPLGFPDAPPVPAAHRMLASLPGGVVAEFPFFWNRSEFPRHALYMLFSTYHWHPLVNGYSDHIPADFRRMVVPLSSFPTRESFGILRERRTRYVVFHLNMYDRRSREKLLDRLQQYGQYLRPLAREGEVWLYEIVEWPRH